MKTEDVDLSASVWSESLKYNWKIKQRKQLLSSADVGTDLEVIIFPPPSQSLIGDDYHVHF